MNTQVKSNPYKTIVAQLAPGQRFYIRITRIFLSLLMASFMMRAEVLLFVLPVLMLPYIAWLGAAKAESWHGSQFPQGYVAQDAALLKKTYLVAAGSGLIFSGFTYLLFQFSTMFGTYLAIIVGSIFLGVFFYTKGLLRGWELIGAPSGTESSLVTPKPVKNVLIWNVIFGFFSIGLALGIVQYKAVVDAADAAHAVQVEQEAANSPMAQGIDAPTDVQTPDQQAQTLQEQPKQGQTPAQQAAPQREQAMSAPTAPVTPEAAAMPAADAASALHVATPTDDPSAIDAMLDLAHQAGAAKPEDVQDGQISVASTSVPLWAHKPRDDSYPPYAAMCDLTKDVCTQLNGAGNYIDASAESLASSLTVVRNADVVSGKYWCGHGVCVDKKMNLVGRVSAAMVQAHPELLQSLRTQ